LVASDLRLRPLRGRRFLTRAITEGHAGFGLTP